MENQILVSFFAKVIKIFQIIRELIKMEAILRHTSGALFTD